MVITDIDKKYWVTVKEGVLDFGSGEIDDPSFTFSATKDVGTSLLFGETDATSAYYLQLLAISAQMAGDITVEGNLQDAMAFQEYQSAFRGQP